MYNFDLLKIGVRAVLSVGDFITLMATILCNMHLRRKVALKNFVRSIGNRQVTEFILSYISDKQQASNVFL